MDCRAGQGREGRELVAVVSQLGVKLGGGAFVAVESGFALTWQF